MKNTCNHLYILKYLAPYGIPNAIIADSEFLECKLCGKCIHDKSEILKYKEGVI